MFCVYEILAPNDDVIYVGLSGDLAGRTYQHYANAKGLKKPLYEVIRLYGRETIRFSRVSRHKTIHSGRRAETERIVVRSLQGQPLCNRDPFSARHLRLVKEMQAHGLCDKSGRRIRGASNRVVQTAPLEAFIVQPLRRAAFA